MRRSGWIVAGGMVVALAAGTLTSTNLSGYRAVYAAGERPASTTPVLVELFTSEGCSSCPPADALLARINRQYPDAVVLSEHVTYWDHIGWRDPFSLEDATARQSAYADRMGLGSDYTPQMVVDGRYQFVGSDAHAAAGAIAHAASAAQVPLTISGLTLAGHRLSFNLEAAPVPADAQLMLVLAQDQGSSHVDGGENGGRTLQHVEIARKFQPIARVSRGDGFHGPVSADLPRPVEGSGWHVVVFLQSGVGGPILGVTRQALSEQNAPSKAQA